MVRDPFGQPSGVDEDERRSVLAHKGRQPVINVRPQGIGRHAAQFVLRHFHGNVHCPPVSDVDHGRHGPISDEEPGDRFDRPLGRGQSDALGRMGRQRLQPFQRQRQMRAALVGRHGMDLIHDDGPDGLQQSTALFCGQ